MRVPTHHHAYTFGLAHTHVYAYTRFHTRALTADIWCAAYQRKRIQP